MIQKILSKLLDPDEDVEKSAGDTVVAFTQIGEISSSQHCSQTEPATETLYSAISETLHSIMLGDPDGAHKTFVLKTLTALAQLGEIMSPQCQF